MPEKDTAASAIVALTQMCSSDEVQQNLKMAQQQIAEAAANGARLIVLPENFAFMGYKNADRLKYKEPAGSGIIQDTIAAAAAKFNIWVVAGTMPIATSDAHKVRAACIVYDNNGKQKARYDKIHLFDATVSASESHMESEHIQAGNTLAIVDTPIGKLGLAVCFDVRFPEQFRLYYEQGVEVLALPAAFTVPTGIAHWHTLVRCRALDTFSFIIAATQGGEHVTGRKTYGHAIAVNPWGKVIAELPHAAPGILYAKINLTEVAKARKAIPLRFPAIKSF